MPPCMPVYSPDDPYFHLFFSMFPVLQFLSIGGCCSDIRALAFCPKVNITLRYPPTPEDQVKPFISSLRDSGPQSLTIPREYDRNGSLLILDEIKLWGKGLIGNVIYWDDDQEMVL